MADQGDLFTVAPIGPPGLAYHAALISPAEESALVDILAGLTFAPFDFQGRPAARHVAVFGARYDYASRTVRTAEPMPAALLPLRARVAAFADRPPEAFEQLLINRYPPGAGIGWHRDKAQFGLVAGVSLLAPCTLRFRLRLGDTWRRAGVELAARSAYLLDGDARWSWEHSIRPHERMRYSITFRTFAAGRT